MPKKIREIDIFSEIRKRAKKAGKAPGTATYTGEKSDIKPVITIVHYSKTDYREAITNTVPDNVFNPDEEGVTWVNVEGLHDVDIIKQLAKQFDLHPLTVEDILNISQRPKVDEFDNYLFITMKAVFCDKEIETFFVKQSSIIIGKGFLLSFQEIDTSLFDNIRARLKKNPHQRLRQMGSDYLAYRLIDEIVDQYFIILEALGDKIEQVESSIITSPSPQIARTIYHLKQQMLILRKAIWPMRETIGHLMHEDETFITNDTRIYLRDVYDHAIQAIDTMETFRDILSSMLDMYLSSLTNRMNEIMKTLTIITTIFIPITAIASIYGMNFTNLPGLHANNGYIFVIASMVMIAIGMLIYFRHKKWI